MPIDAGALHHIGVAVPSLDDAIRFYRDVLGYAVGREHAVRDQRVRVVFATRETSRIELLEPTDRDSGIARFVAERGRATMHHLCFEVDDLAATLERLAAAGVPSAPVNDVLAAVEEARLVEYERSSLGAVRQVASPLRLSDAEPPVKPAPGRGEHTEQVLAELCGYGQDRIRQLAASGAFGPQ
jgi:methylmalonyl-CoA/ethylmalonyl-CoA epimerase